MAKVYIEASNIISSLGFTTQENLQNVLEGKTGLLPCSDSSITATTIPASQIKQDDIDSKFKAIGDVSSYTKFEKLSILSINDCINQSEISLEKDKTLFILSTTKGNIELLDKTKQNPFSDERLLLSKTAKTIIGFFNKDIPTQVISNACISGVAAIILGQRLIKEGLYDNVIVNGTDVLSKFVVSGFQSFMSLSEQACRPFNADRNGLSLGEGSATVILTNKAQQIEVSGGATSNDANHISGPSRTGEGLLIAIENTLNGYKDVSFISAHGTATPYNDDMESKAIFRANLNSVETNSLKGYFGHTLGAAGVIESIINIEALKINTLIKTIGCTNQGTAEKINISKETKEQKLTSLLKLASGFGGCNAAALFIKHE